MRNQAADMAIVQAMMTDESPVHLNTDVAGAAVFVAGVMLVERMPGLSTGFHRVIKGIRETIRQALRTIAPEYADMLRDGYKNADDPGAVAAMSKSDAVVIAFTLRDAWLLVSVMQAATRGELPADVIERVTTMGRQLQAQIAAVRPEANDLMEAGWGPTQDVER